jgi:hypothetical protein
MSVAQSGLPEAHAQAIEKKPRVAACSNASLMSGSTRDQVPRG